MNKDTSFFYKVVIAGCVLVSFLLGFVIKNPALKNLCMDDSVDR